MFRESISYPIDPISTEYVKTLHRPDMEPDYSLTCLGVALLRKRIENYEGIGGYYSGFDKEQSCFLDFEERNSGECNYPVFYYYSYSGNDEDSVVNDKMLELGYKQKDSIGLLLKDKAGVKCAAYYHTEKNSAVIFINSRDMRYYHLIISCIPVLFPLLFKDKPLEEVDYNLLKSLSKSEKDVFIQRIKESVKPYAIEFRRLMLSSLLKNLHEAKINAARNNVTDQRNQLEYLDRQIAEAYVKLKQLIVVYEGMKATEEYDNPEEEFVEYLATTPEINNVRVEGSTIYFTVATLLSNYNENAWEVFAKRGGIYDGEYKTQLLDAFRDRANRKIILDDLFSDSPNFMIKIAGNYSFNVETCRLRTDSGFDYVRTDAMYKSYIPNPHLKLFACLGGYKDRVNTELHNRNYVEAVRLCIASAASVDLDETDQTFRPFLGWVLSSREKILRRKDGVEMTPEEALIWLVDKEKMNETA